MAHQALAGKQSLCAELPIVTKLFAFRLLVRTKKSRYDFWIMETQAPNRLKISENYPKPQLHFNSWQKWLHWTMYPKSLLKMSSLKTSKIFFQLLNYFLREIILYRHLSHCSFYYIISQQIQDNIFKKVDPMPSFLMHTQRSRIQNLCLF